MPLEPGRANSICRAIATGCLGKLGPAAWLNQWRRKVRMSSTTSAVSLMADPVLPQRDLLLEPMFMAGLFSRELGVDGPIVLDGCEHIRTTYRAGESLRVAYRVSAPGRSCVVAGRAFPQGGSRRCLEQEKMPAINGGPFRPLFRHAE